jgi:hypothetical protein
MLRYLVLSASDLDRVAKELDGKLSVLADRDNQRAAAIESKGELQDAHSKPVYWEVGASNLSELDKVKAAGRFAKIRTGAIKPEGIPSTKEVAEFIVACAERKLAFKATAGLHHPIKAEYALTYEANAPRAVMHGFLNVMVAAAFAWNGDKDVVEPILQETNAKAFQFSNQLNWNGKTLTEAQIKEARKNFMHAIGSCSFEEPVEELKALRLLP